MSYELSKLKSNQLSNSLGALCSWLRNFIYFEYFRNAEDES